MGTVAVFFPHRTSFILIDVPIHAGVHLVKHLFGVAGVFHRFELVDAVVLVGRALRRRVVLVEGREDDREAAAEQLAKLKTPFRTAGRSSILWTPRIATSG